MGAGELVFTLSGSHGTPIAMTNNMLNPLQKVHRRNMIDSLLQEMQIELF